MRKVKENQIRAMKQYYGTIDRARQAYREARDEVKEWNEDDAKYRTGGKVIWIGINGRISAKFGNMLSSWEVSNQVLPLI